jgi:hypothetical protein
MVEDVLGCGISARGDVDACLLIEPPGWQSEFPGEGAGLVQRDAVGLEDRVDVAGGTTGVIGQRMAAPPTT